MTALVGKTRSVIRFLLATLLWLHALFLLNIHTATVSVLTRLLHLTASEVVLFGLLLLFSFLAGAGFWSGIGNLAYIYFFPFVLFFYFCYVVFLLLLAIARWFRVQTTTQLVEGQQQPQSVVANPTIVDASSGSKQLGNARQKLIEVALVLLRPVRSFTVLWCFLLLFTTHVNILWLSLTVVLSHLVRTIFRVVRLTLFSGTWFGKMEAAIRNSVDTTLSKLSIVTRESAPTDDLKNLWNSVSLFEKGVRLLENEVLVSRWAWVFCGVFLSVVYVYLAILFSFAYYGIARVNGVAFSWTESLVTSAFIPFLISDLPKTAALKLLGGLHCTLIVSVGAGTVIKYFRRRLESIRSVATIVSVRLADENIRQKYLILQEKFATAGASSVSASGQSERTT